MSEPKPLDLKDIEKKTFEYFCEMLFETKKPRDITEWSDIGKIGGEHGIDAEEIQEVVEFTIKEIKHRIKSACEFYLRYKNNPELLIKEHPEYEEDVKMFLDEYETAKAGVNVWYLRKYNEWLFRLAFKDVLEGEEKC